jgi:hypothetical protein
LAIPFATAAGDDKAPDTMLGETEYENWTELWIRAFGGANTDYFKSVAAVEGGFVAVGNAAKSSFGTGTLSDLTSYGSDDAIAVMYDLDGNVVWAKNFGGSNNDYFVSVVSFDGGFVAVGSALASTSFGNGTFSDLKPYGNQDAIAVMCDLDGNVLWAKNFGGAHIDDFVSVASFDGGFVAVGNATKQSFGTGTFSDLTAYGIQDAIAVMFDLDGNVVWVKNFGGEANNYFTSVASVDGGFVAVGYASSTSFGNGTFSDLVGYGDHDTIAVMCDLDGNVVWVKNFGGVGHDYFYGVASFDDGFVAVGAAVATSFGNGTFSDLTSYGNQDAIAVMCDIDGNVVWVKSIGGYGSDKYVSVVSIEGGFVSVGDVVVTSFGTGKLSGITSYGSQDAIAVMYDLDGNAVWAKNFGGVGTDYFYCVASFDDGFIAVGSAAATSFGNGKLSDVTGYGNIDAIAVMYYWESAVIDGGGDDKDSENDHSALWTIAGVIILIVGFVALLRSPPIGLIILAIGALIIVQQYVFDFVEWFRELIP